MNQNQEPSVIKAISIPSSLWEEALAKAQHNAQSLSAVIRLLLRLWLDGKIDLAEGGNNEKST